jgi:hypothetical protein
MPMNILTCPVSTLRSIMRLLIQDPQRTIHVRVGFCAAGTGVEWLARDILAAPPTGGSTAKTLLFRVATAVERPVVPASSPHVVGHLFLGDGSRRGQLWGAITRAEQPEPLDALHLIGPGMHRLPVQTPLGVASASEPSRSEPKPPHAAGEQAQPEQRWSRTIGALGGTAAWKRLSSLRVGVIGCGRSGSLAATALARLGVRELLLIDPDRVETHNLGEMDGVPDTAVGHPKVVAVVKYLRSMSPYWPESLVPLVASVTSQAGLTASRGCDVLFCCVDSDAARFATAILATLYHRVLVDIGTGILTGTGATDQNTGARRAVRRLGADVRLILPGDGCLLCRGDLRNYAGAVADLTQPAVPAQPPVAQDWRAQRAGSFRSLNQMAVAVGVQMLQDLVVERLPGSTWAHLEFDDHGRLAVQYPTPAPRPDCPLCTRAGLGDLDLGLPLPSASGFR